MIKSYVKKKPLVYENNELMSASAVTKRSWSSLYFYHLNNIYILGWEFSY